VYRLSKPSDARRLLVHSQGCLQNAMIDIGIATAGGRVFGHSNWETAFSQAAAALATRRVTRAAAKP
jgi:hypothetical protein